MKLKLNILVLSLFWVITLLFGCDEAVKQESNVDPPAVDVGNEEEMSMPEGTSGPSGFLLTFSEGNKYQTVYLKHENGKISKAYQKPLIITPQAKGWMYLYEEPINQYLIQEMPEEDWGWVEDTVINEFYAEVIRIETDKSKIPGILEYLQDIQEPEPPACESCTNWDMSEGLNIAYVTPGYLCIDGGGTSYQGGAHPNNSSEGFLMKFPKDLKPFMIYGGSDYSDNFPDYNAAIEMRLEADDLLPAQGKSLERINNELLVMSRLGLFIDSFEEGVGARLETFRLEDHMEVLDPEYESEEDFMDHEVGLKGKDAFLERKEGQLHLMVRAYADAAYAESGDYEFTAETSAGPAGKPITSYNRIQPAFSQWEKTVPGISDVFLSPENDIAWLQKGGTLIAWSIKKNEKIGEFKLSDSELNVIQAEWATGSYVDKWAEAGQFQD